LVTKAQCAAYNVTVQLGRTDWYRVGVTCVPSCG